MLGVYPELERLVELAAQDNHDSLQRQEVAELKLELTETVLAALLEVQSANAQIETEEAEAREIRAQLEQRRDRAINYNSAANFVSGGVSDILGGAFELSPRTAKTGSIVDILGGGIQTCLSILALREQAGRGHTATSNPNMLARLFELKADDDSQYSDLIWKYLNSPPLNSRDGLSRRQVLLNNWAELGRFNRKSQKDYQHTVAQLSDSIGKVHTVNISLLGNRARMLADLSALVAQVNRDLLELMRTIRKAGGYRPHTPEAGHQ